MDVPMDSENDVSSFMLMTFDYFIIIIIYNPLYLCIA